MSIEHNPLLAVTPEDIARWTSAANLQGKAKRIFQGFELIDGLDNGAHPDREVSLAVITHADVYPQHIHQNSDALFFIIEGSALLMSGLQRTPVTAGDHIEIPRGMPHGFTLPDGGYLAFVTVQSPPIRNKETDEEDFHLTDAV